jgi:zinc protease
VNRVELEVREELDRALRDGFTEDEIRQAKQGYREERVLGRSDDGALAAGWTGNLDLDRTYEFSRQFESRVEAVTADQLVSVARKYLDLSKMTIVVAGDAKKGAH